MHVLKIIKTDVDGDGDRIQKHSFVQISSLVEQKKIISLV